jgi:hypothetical protein
VEKMTQTDENQGLKDGIVSLHDLADRVERANSPRPVPLDAWRPAAPMMHGSIVKAIAAIQKTLHAVAKNETNSFGKYKFVSTDDIYAALTKKMGEVELSILTTERDVEVKRFENKKGEVAQWLKVTFGFILATPEGSYTDPSLCRTLFIQVTGPQTFAAAQSFAHKAFLRSLFLIPTGEKDLDEMPQADTEEEQLALNQPQPKRKSSAQSKRDGDEKRYNTLKDSIFACSSRDDLLQLRIQHMGQSGESWGDWPLRWADLLEQDFLQAAKDLGLDMGEPE